ncbi:exonuclease III [Rubellimicrobium rubrum]|uniref:Exonuclease III n=1 Tax=Rubellimicrobium rubrum TaxID=2585369 RepID=A0A5C4MZH9_9RHOB|nr:endonuclease/exonuclease/phosphatase family protein [Rubellimicrobium rubrum]TNC49322.1 exonuclease III [Rubellimicrobium rubrum]
MMHMTGPSSIRITTLNLRHGGSSRVPAIADWLLETESNVIVCTEFRQGASGDRLSERLAQAGYVHRVAASQVSALNTVCIFSRHAVEAVHVDLPAKEQHRLAAIRIGPLTVAGVYFSQLKAKLPLFEYLLARPKELLGPAVLTGDFNTGLHHLDEDGATFYCANEFRRLSQTGWVDAWRLINGDARDFSWQSNAGNGFRIDHAFVTSDLAHRITRAVYDHSPRSGLTDHAALSVDLSHLV